jgi:uncharacterized protein YbbC (DUF1343 family)
MVPGQSQKEILTRGAAIVVSATLGLVACGSSGQGSDGDEVGSASQPEPSTATSTLDAWSPPSVSADPEQGIPVRVGAGVLADEGFRWLHGRRVGLITNSAAQVDGERTLDLLARSEGVDLVAVFAPEHGIESNQPAGANVADTSVASDDGELVVHSLYGSKRAPTQDLLAGIDVLVFDLQDVGVRAYTYLATMGLAMEAAAEAQIPFVVLDRPNPLGGEYLAGFVRDPGLDSFVSAYPIPSVHGLTAGELALAIKGEGWVAGLDDLQLEVVAMQGWHRGLIWPDTGLAWAAPSPNLPDNQASAVYPGTVLFEATSLSVGRGTPEPFTLIGAPWLDGEQLAGELNARSLPGVRIEPTTFTPEPSPAAPDPAYADQALNGIRIVVTDPSTLAPVELGVHLLEAIVAQSSTEAVVAQPDLLDLLAGSVRMRQGLEAGLGAEAIIASWDEEVTAYAAWRRSYLLYD